MKSGGKNNREMQPAIDWGKVRKHLKSVQTALEHGRALPDKEKKKILRDRARALAQEEEKETSGQDYLEIIEFVLAYETYGIASAYVREIYPLTEITPLPGMPPFVRGIVNVRGQILSVIDLKKFFELPEKGLTDLNKIIVIQDNTMEFGILADTVLGIRRLSTDGIEQSLPTLTGIRARYLKGITGERTVILDAAKILSDENIIIAEGRETK